MDIPAALSPNKTDSAVGVSRAIARTRHHNIDLEPESTDTQPARRYKRTRCLSPSSHRPYSRGILKTYEKSALQLRLENTIQSPGGTKKILHIIQNQATCDEIQELNQSEWTPLVGAIFRFGKNTTRKKGNSPQSEKELVTLIQACHEKGLSLNSGGWFGEHYHRPLVLAAYYGYHAAVKIMLKLGALPDLADGEGRTAWFAAFENPVYSGGTTQKFRDCDRQTAQVLCDMGAVTGDLGRWKSTVLACKGSICYMNGDSCNGSVMLRAITSKNLEVVKFLHRRGGIVTDRDFLELDKRDQVQSRLVPVIRSLLSGDFGKCYSSKDLCRKASANTIAICSQDVDSWNLSNDFSFPPTWKLGLLFSQNCGVPGDIFNAHVVPFLSRDWFYTEEQLNGPIPARLGASSMNLVGFSRDLAWVKTT
mmetsp:Transcript_23118/g.46811  ORF Transcript_23118/g.46811 Transcript_23118/m.46811 type:complete len:421 (-) Transcript_23118:167-1429(-)